MKPLILIPARQLSEGRPCKNREAWPALLDCLSELSPDWPAVVLTDDPMIACAYGSHPTTICQYRYMDRHHTVAECARVVLATEPWGLDPLVILQPSSPSRSRASYVKAAVALLRAEPTMSSVTSVVRWEGCPPSKACYLTDDGRLTVPPIEARQAHPQAYRRDGTVYAVRRQWAQAGDLYGPRPVPLLVSPGDSVTWD